MLHLDVDGLRNTQVGKLLMQRLTTGDDNHKMNALAAWLGCDPRKDLAGVTLYGPPGVSDDGVVILGGKFNQQQMETYVKADAAYQGEAYKGTTIHSWIDKKKNKRMWGAFMNGGSQIVISGVDSALKTALDTISGQAGSSLATQNSCNLALGTANGAVLVAAADMSKIKGTKPNAQTLKQAKAASASIGEQGNDMVATISIEADSAVSAQQMTDMARGILAMIQLDDKTDAKTKEALRATTIDAQGTSLKVAIHMPAQTLADAMQKKWQEEDQKKAADTTQSK